CAVILILSAERITEPSTTASTPSSSAICGSGFLCLPRYRIADVRDITLSARILDRSVINCSVIPSAKNSCSGSLERFSNGSTATESIRPGEPELQDFNRGPNHTVKIAKAAARISQRYATGVLGVVTGESGDT